MMMVMMMKNEFDGVDIDINADFNDNYDVNGDDVGDDYGAGKDRDDNDVANNEDDDNN